VVALHAAQSAPLLDWGVAVAPRQGERECGDVHLVQEVPGGALAAVIDGLGHGEEAATAAEQARDVLAQYREQSLIALVRRCHEALAGSRGVVMGVAAFSVADGTMSWVGVGNVEGFLHRADRRAAPRREDFLVRSGVVGHQLPHLHASVVTVERGDLVVLTTDGVRPEFRQGFGLLTALPVQRLADQILRDYHKPVDDALVLVGRVSARGPNSR
jgi:hypothetical protein